MKCRRPFWAWVGFGEMLAFMMAGIVVGVGGYPYWWALVVTAPTSLFIGFVMDAVESSS